MWPSQLLICSSRLVQPSFDVDPEKGPFQKERLVFSGGVQIKERVA